VNLNHYINEMYEKATQLNNRYKADADHLPKHDHLHLHYAVEAVSHAALSACFQLLLDALVQAEKLGMPVDLTYEVEEDNPMAARITVPCNEAFWGTPDICIIRTPEKDMDEDSISDEPWFGVTRHTADEWTTYDLLAALYPYYLSHVQKDIIVPAS